MRFLFLALLGVLSALPAATAAAPLSYFLPEDETFDPAVPSPEAILGGEFGEWHVRHDQIVAYYRAVADASDRVQLFETGRTYENRPILLAVVGDPGAIQDLDRVRERHRQFASSSAPSPGDEDRAVVWLCYSVHGNESSGANASLLALYYLAAGQSSRVRDTLANTVVLIDPSLNPDGLDRFAHWTNSNRSLHASPDPLTREHQEAWPSGRTNHYWFDLNRDWLLLTHPESRARIETFQKWKPNVLCDFHEMGTNSTFFFQPGVPARRNPLTPPRNEAITADIAAFHAKAFDQDGRLYYSGESFDDFYYGKGSTYPDAQGCIGILFEQASARGRRQNSINGVVEFPFTIRNQFTTTLSTLEAAVSMRKELLEYQGWFFAHARRGTGSGGYVFGDPYGPERTQRLVDLLQRHDIEVYRLEGEVSAGGHTFNQDFAFVAPSAQDQTTLLTAIFEERTEFADSLFYDVSAWTLPHALNVPFARVGSAGSLTGDPAGGEDRAKGGAETLPEAYAYALDWSAFSAPRALQELLSGGVRARVTLSPMTVQTGDDAVQLSRGSILIPMGIQDLPASEVQARLSGIIHTLGLNVTPINGGMTPQGPDLGSPSVVEVKTCRPLLVVGSGVRSYEAGEIWHLLDYRMGLPLTLVERDRLKVADLDSYTHLILAGGTYRWDDAWAEELKTWVRGGGVILAVGSANTWIQSRGLAPLAAPKTEEEKNEAPPEPRPYDQRSQDRGALVTGGAIVETHLDLTHPIAFGYRRDRLPVFRNSNRTYLRSKNPYANVAWYTEEPLLAGYVHQDNLAKLPGLASVLAHREGRGAVISYIDNPNFRGVWDGTSKLFLNGLFFGHLAR